MAFDVAIVFGQDVSSSSVKATGEEAHPLRSDQYATFGLSDDLLKDAVEAYLGKRPDSVYLSDPTPGNLYQSRNWEPVTVRLRPASASIVSIDTTPTQLAMRELTNNSSKPADYDCSVSADVTDSVDTNWSNTLALGFSQSVNYGTNFVGGETSINLQTDFQKGGSQSRSVSMGVMSGVMVALEPGEKVIATLTASKGTMNVRVLFDVYLTGVIAARFDSVYKWQHDWPVDIAGALEALRSTNRLTITNDIAIDYFSSGEVSLSDQAGQRVRVRFRHAPVS